MFVGERSSELSEQSNEQTKEIARGTVPPDCTEEFLKLMQEMDKVIAMRTSVTNILEYSTVCPFKWLKNSYSCFYCDLISADPAVLREHHSAEHAAPPVKKFVKKIKKHQMVKVDVTSVDCKICDEPIRDFFALKTHLTDVHNKTINPKYSDGTLPFRLTLGTLKCEMCEDLFTEFKTLNQHMNKHFRNFICESCGAGFITPERLRTHGLSHETGSVPCDQCDKVFRSMFAKNEHIANIHRQVKRHRCPHCNEAFRNYFQRNKHITNVHKIKCKEFSCSICGKVFTLSGKLTHHVKTVHLKQKRHTCSVCNWKVYSKSELKDHMIRHGGERIHECKICKKSYARKYTLREHMRIHNNDRRFICSICGKAFVQNCSLKHHMKVHHPDVAGHYKQDRQRDGDAVKVYSVPSLPHHSTMN